MASPTRLAAYFWWYRHRQYQHGPPTELICFARIQASPWMRRAGRLLATVVGEQDSIARTIFNNRLVFESHPERWVHRHIVTPLLLALALLLGKG